MTVSDTPIHAGVSRGRQAQAAARRGTSDFSELADQVRASGLLRRRYGYYWVTLAALPLVFGGAFLAFVVIGDSWWQLLTAAGFAVMFTQAAFLGHDAAHRQIFRSGKWNDWVSLIIGDLFVGMSYGWWQHKHTRHHANPNQVDADPDIELPVITLTPAQTARHRAAPLRWLIAHQGWFFFPILLFEGLSLHASSVRRVLSREPVARRATEIVFIAVRLGGYLTLVLLVLSPGKAAAFLAVQLGLFGFYMGMSFAPNHKGMPIVEKGIKLDFLRRQVLTSRDIRGNPLLDVLMGGLNYQIEHHLFPSMPRPHLRLVAPMVADYCRSRGIAYTQTGLLESYGIVVRHINRAGLGERDPFECPVAAARRSI
jgi:fatty acid desaturase